MSMQEQTSDTAQQIAPVGNDQNPGSDHDHREELTPDDSGNQGDQGTEEQGAGEQQTDDKPARDESGRFKGVQPRIDELTRARREAEREAEYWRQLATQGNAQSSAPAAPTKPTPDQFADHNEFIEALTDWKAEQAVAKAQAKVSDQRADTARAQTFQERQAAVRVELPDYDEVVGKSNTPLANHVGAILLDSDFGPQLSYEFAKNPDALMKLNGMDPVSAAREIGRMEAKFVKSAGDPTPEPKVPPRKLTEAATPPSTLGSQGRSNTPTLATMSMEEYKATRAKQGARWSR